ncbi:MAG: aldehyde ferredoxin oxidoreductase family protein [Candidatus Bipolaricaulis sp.]|nr:aldehyde ferredoxin oxidoreductase family protein [Candidatus Bipolaricaulis sp.]
MKGVYGRYLDVDLSSGRIRDVAPPEEWYALHLGGRGMGARLILESTPPGGNRSDEPWLVFATGPLQGTGLAGAGRHAVVGRSPKTGAIMDASAGGFVGHELGRSGYDGILLRGTAAAPCYLLLVDGKAELRAAEDLWGLETGPATNLLSARHPKAHVAVIGPAGERRVQMACIMHDRSRAIGRPGFGAVMGKARLKAVVVRGSQDKPLADPAAFSAARAAFVKALAEDPGLKSLGTHGTSRGVLGLNETGILPTENFRRGTFDGAASICGQAMVDSILVGRETCFGCPIRCKRVVQTAYGGEEVSPEYGGPEYETLAAFGSLCLCDNLPAIALANQLCNALGVDTISCGIAIAALMEASERGLIEDRVRWGDPAAIVRWVRRIALREGIGDEIADGPVEWARSIGDASLVQAIKGVELPMHDPRGKAGFGLSYAASPRGATHMEGMHDPMLEAADPTPELGIQGSVDRRRLAGKAGAAVTYENLRSFTNSLVMCAFTNQMSGPRYNYAPIRRLLEHATGMGITVEEMLAIGARNFDLLRLSSGLVGYRRRDDDLPPRLYEPLPEGNSAGVPFDRRAFQAELDAYYEIRGWNERGPSDERLRTARLEPFCGWLAAPVTVVPQGREEM